MAFDWYHHLDRWLASLATWPEPLLPNRDLWLHMGKSMLTRTWRRVELQGVWTATIRSLRIFRDIVDDRSRLHYLFTFLSQFLDQLWINKRCRIGQISEPIQQARDWLMHSFSTWLTRFCGLIFDALFESRTSIIRSFTVSSHAVLASRSCKSFESAR